MIGQRRFMSQAKVLEKIVAKIPAGRLGEALEIARGVEFLVSDDAGFITGFSDTPL